MRDGKYDELMWRAVSASHDTTEVRDDEGQVARIVRDDSYPGAVCVTLDATEDKTRYSTQWRLPAVESRPSFYPDGVPFVSGLSCMAKQASRRLFVIWDGENSRAPDPELGGRSEPSLPAALRDSLVELIAQRDAGEPLGKAGLKKMVERLGDKSVREWAAETSEPDERMATAFESMVSDCLEAGWREEDVSEDLSFTPLIRRTVALRRADLERALVLSGTRGMCSILLTQEPAESSHAD